MCGRCTCGSPTTRTARCPSVYVIQGMTGMADAWFNVEPWSASYPDRIEALQPQAVVVLVDAFTAVGGSQYLDSPGIGNYHTYLCDELVPVRRREPSRRRPTLRTAASRGSRPAATASMITPLLRPDLFGGLATHAGDALFEVCYARDFAPAARALRDAYGGSFDAFWEDFRSGRPVLSSPYDELLVNTYAMCAAYSSNDDGTVDLPFDLETGELVDEVWQRWLALRSRRCSRASRRTPRRCAACAASGSTRGATTSTTSSSARPRSTARSSPPASRTSVSTSSSSPAPTAA